MNCTNDTKHWTIYDARYKQFHYLSHEEFKDFLINNPVKLVGRYIKVNNMEKIWIDGLLNTDWLK